MYALKCDVEGMLNGEAVDAHSLQPPETVDASSWRPTISRLNMTIETPTVRVLFVRHGEVRHSEGHDPGALADCQLIRDCRLPRTPKPSYNESEVEDTPRVNAYLELHVQAIRTVH